jgi:hypothetical protein
MFAMYSNNVGFEALTAVIMKSSILAHSLTLKSLRQTPWSAGWLSSDYTTLYPRR